MAQFQRKVLAVKRVDTAQLLPDLRQEQERLDAAISALEALNGIGAPRRLGRPKGGTSFNPAEFSKPKRKMSAAARKRISEAAKKRWARLIAITQAKK